MSTAATIIPIMIAAQQEEILTRFRKAGATSRRKAIDYAPDDAIEKDLFKDLVKERVLVRTRAGLYYLDERRLKAHEGEQARIALWILGMIVVGALIALVIASV